MMSKKDYTQFAAILREARRDYPHPKARQATEAIEDMLCNFLRSDNPAFDRDRFRFAASYPEGSR